MRVLGFDPGTRKLSYSLVEDGALVVAASYAAEETLSRPSQLYNVSMWAANLVDTLRPDWVWMESIIVGNNRKYSVRLAEIFGAVMTRIYEQDLGIGTVDNKQWKKEIIGNGNANKEDIQAWVGERYPYNFMNQDEVDATCIALYGYSTVGKADGLRLE